jgi:hypothetical protein
MNDPSSRLVTRVAYGASQLPRRPLRPVIANFCNKICQKRTFHSIRGMSVSPRKRILTKWVGASALCRLTHRKRFRWIYVKIDRMV